MSELRPLAEGSAIQTTHMISYCKAITFLRWTHLAMVLCSVQNCKAFPGWMLTKNVLLSPRLEGVTSQREVRSLWVITAILSFKPDIFNSPTEQVFPKVASTVLYSCPPVQDRREPFYFPIKPFRRRSKPIHCFETSMFEKGSNGRNSPAWAKPSPSYSTGSPSEAMN